MQAPRTTSLRQVALSPEEFLRAGPKPINQENNWAREFPDGDRVDDSHPIWRAPVLGSSADRFADALEALAGTDTPKSNFPDDFFTRDVIDGD